MNNIKKELYSIIKSIVITLISGAIVDLYKNDFNILKINLNSFKYNICGVLVVDFNNFYFIVVKI